MKERLQHEWITEDITDWFPGALTVRVGNIGASSIQIAIERSQKLIESSLFSMSYLRNSPLTLTVNWPTSQLPLRRPERFAFGQHPSGANLPLPTARYNTEMTRYYQLGLSSDDPILKFLAFYQVLEYEFIAVSDEKLYQRLQRQLFDPHFTPTPKHLDRVIQEVLDYHRETDQEKMLKNILERYVDEDELIKFVSEYESYLEERLYTSQRNLFGSSVKVTLQKGHVYGNIALVIKTVRNALVHSSDRYERAERHVPFSESTGRVVKDVPLMKYLAEKVIVGSATELS
jgi:nucleoside diphosphate kinase